MTRLAGGRHRPAHVTDRGRLAADLARAVRGEVRFDRGSQALYANDASIYRQVPIGVVIPRDAGDVLAALEAGNLGSRKRWRWNAMGLSARERQALHMIEGGLVVSAPGLASRLAVFTRLTTGEAFPARESIRAAGLRVGFRWPLAWPVLWLVISLALIATALAVGHAGGAGTCAVLAPSCAWHTAGYTPW